MYDSVASSKVFKAFFVHSRGHLSRNYSRMIPELTTSWCSISRTVRTDAFIGHGGLPWWEATNWSWNSLHTLAVHYIVSYPPSTLIWRYSNLIACWFLLLRHPVMSTVTAQGGTKVLGKYRRKIRKVWKELCYGKAETLEDAEGAARWWRYNLV